MIFELSDREVLLEYSKKLRKSIYKIDENLKSIMPSKVNNGVLEDEIEYCKKLIKAVQSDYTFTIHNFTFPPYISKDLSGISLTSKITQFIFEHI